MGSTRVATLRISAWSSLVAPSGLRILLAVGLFFVWGGILFGVLPGQPGVSWQAHLFGALTGLLAARLVAGADRRASRAA